MSSAQIQMGRHGRGRHARRLEVNDGLNPLVNDASADPDGDGFTNLYDSNDDHKSERLLQRRPIQSQYFEWDDQVSAPSSWLPQPLIVRVTNTSNAPPVNAPVTFSLGQASGGLSQTNGGSGSVFLLSEQIVMVTRLFITNNLLRRIVTTVLLKTVQLRIKQVTFTMSTGSCQQWIQDFGLRPMPALPRTATTTLVRGKISRAIISKPHKLTHRINPFGRPLEQVRCRQFTSMATTSRSMSRM